MVKREDITDHTSIRGWIIATSCHGVGMGWTGEKVRKMTGLYVRSFEN